jgi:hypothetical protein
MPDVLRSRRFEIFQIIRAKPESTITSYTEIKVVLVESEIKHEILHKIIQKRESEDILF